MSRRRKVIIALVVVGLALVIAGIMVGRYYWYRGYQRGAQTGVIRKLAIKGSPMCRYMSGEVVLVGTNVVPGQQPQIWEFTLDDHSPGNPLLKKLEEAQKQAKTVTLNYRQDLGNKGKLWTCAPTDYYVVGVE